MWSLCMFQHVKAFRSVWSLCQVCIFYPVYGFKGVWSFHSWKFLPVSSWGLMVVHLMPSIMYTFRIKFKDFSYDVDFWRIFPQISLSCYSPVNEWPIVLQKKGLMDKMAISLQYNSKTQIQLNKSFMLVYDFYTVYDEQHNSALWSGKSRFCCGEFIFPNSSYDITLSLMIMNDAFQLSI